jgi:undecaprenyl-diphosphatase
LHLLAAASTALPSPLQNDYVLSLILGIIEGLTEFLPVSSTAHLRIAEALLNLPLETGYWKMYSIVIQLGAILCLPIYFFPEIMRFIRSFPQGKRGDRTVLTHPLSLTLIAFVVTAIPTFFLTKIVGENLDNFYVIGSALFFGGIVMWVVDARFGSPRIKQRGFDLVTAELAAHGRQTKVSGVSIANERYYRTNDMDEMTIAQAVTIGACQILSAVFPGASRSMTTIAAGQVVGMSRPAALEFSFFLSIPTMLAATLFTLKKAIFPKPGDGDAFTPNMMTPHDWIVLAIGFVISFVVAFGVVAWFMAWVRRRGFAPFAIYRLILGAVVLYFAFHAAGG